MEEYIKQGFASGQILKAKHLNYMEEGISILSQNVANISASLNNNDSINLYGPSLQTNETIAPHYYVAGVPYTSTNYDAMWNCTAPIPVKPNTMYTVGLVPAYHYVYGSENIMIEKPWSHAGNGCFFTTLMGNILRALVRQTRSRHQQTALVSDLIIL